MFLNLLTNDEKWDEDIRSKDGEDTFYPTLSLWRLILTNLGLRKLELSKKVGHLGYTIFDDPVEPAESFLVLALSRHLLPVRHLKIGWECRDMLLCRLANFFSSLESFVHVGHNVAFRPSFLPPSYHLNLRVLAFGNRITPVQMRAVLLVFPGLQSLSVTRKDSPRHHGWKNTVDAMYQGFNYLQQKIEEYGSLQSLDICDLSLIEKASDRLSRTQTLTCDAKTFSSAGAIQKTLNLCPVLNRLEFSAEQRQHLIEEALSQFSTIDFDRGLNKKPHPLKALINSDPNDECFTSLLNLATTIPSQVESRDYEVLIAITTTSKALEYARFSLEAPYPDELCQFFASCSRLKECLGGGHIIAAEDLITPSEWACMGLEKLDIDVRELPSLDIFHSSLPIETSSAGTVLDTTKVSENQKASYATRRQVFIALARHKSLIKLKFGSEETSMPWYHRPWSSGRDFDTFTGFEFSLESGFDEVAALPRLEREGDMRGFGSAFYSDSGAEVDAGLWLASKCGSGYDK